MSDAEALSISLLEARLAAEPDADRLQHALEPIDPAELGNEGRVAFWLNLYNTAVIAELDRKPRTGSLLRHRSIFATGLLRVGGREYSLDLIEHGLLRRNARPPYRARRVLRGGDPRLAGAPRELDPRVHFALNCGATSCPAIRPYRAATLDRDLETATRGYVGAEAVIDRDASTLVLPYLLRLYAADFGGRAAARAWGASKLPRDDAAWVIATEPAISFGRFDWTLVDRRA